MAQIDRAFTLKTLQELIRIDSRNPGLEAGAPGEREAARYVGAVLGKLGWETQYRDLGNNRANVVARRPGSGGGPSLMINVHLDTVGVAGMNEPFSGALREGRIWGRGAQDIKGGVAAALGLARLLSQTGMRLRGDLVLAFVADEEHQSLGTERLIEQVKTDAAIVLEPSELDVCVAHRGFGIFRLRTRGRAAHGGDAGAGIDANRHMGHLLVALDGLGEKWRRECRHAMLGAATLHVPLVGGGRQLFMYAPECTADLECRTVPGQSPAAVLRELQSIVRSLAQRIVDFNASVDLVQWRQPYEIDPERPIVRTVVSAVETVLGQPPRLISHPWWEDSALLGGAGIDALVIGPRGGGLHTEAEWVDVDSVVALAEVLYRSALAYCGTNGA